MASSCCSAAATATCIFAPGLLIFLIVINNSVLLLGEARPSGFKGLDKGSRPKDEYRSPLEQHHYHGGHHGGGHSELKHTKSHRETRPVSSTAQQQGRHRGGLVQVTTRKMEGGAFPRDGGGSEKEFSSRRRRRAAKAMVGHEEEKNGGCSPCGEVYVVRDAGETLQTISALCHVSSIEDDNPHINDYDDLAPGALLFISSTLPPCS